MHNENIDPKDEQRNLELRASSPANPQEDQQTQQDKEQQSAKDAQDTTTDDD